jgi:hypothetical protein
MVFFNSVASYVWHSDAQLNRLFAYHSPNNLWGSEFYQNTILGSVLSPPKYNNALAINSIQPSYPTNVYWDNIGDERDGYYHYTSNGSGWSELLSFPNSISTSQRQGIESNQLNYFNISPNPPVDITNPIITLIQIMPLQIIDNEVKLFGVSGSNLSNDVIVTAPLGFEISILPNINNNYTNTLTLSRTESRKVSSTIYIRRQSGSQVNSGLISISSAADGLTESITINQVPPTFNNPTAQITLCQNGSYFLDPSSTNGTFSSSVPSVATVNSSGYVTAVSSSGTTVISLTNSGGTVTATLTVGTTSSLTITDPTAKPNYKFDGSPYGPAEGIVNYLGYNGFTYASQTKPSNTGFYRASRQNGNEAGCPVQFYIIKCDSCQ